MGGEVRKNGIKHVTYVNFSKENAYICKEMFIYYAFRAVHHANNSPVFDDPLSPRRRQVMQGREVGAARTQDRDLTFISSGAVRFK